MKGVNQMPEERILRLPAVVKMTGISRSRIYVYMARGTDPFPRSIKLGTNMVGWRQSEIKAWLNSRQRSA